MSNRLICGECGAEVEPEYELGANPDRDYCTIWCDTCNAPAGGLEGVAYRLEIDRYADLVEEVEGRMAGK